MIIALSEKADLLILHAFKSISKHSHDIVFINTGNRGNSVRMQSHGGQMYICGQNNCSA